MKQTNSAEIEAIKIAFANLNVGSSATAGDRASWNALNEVLCANLSPEEANDLGCIPNVTINASRRLVKGDQVTALGHLGRRFRATFWAYEDSNLVSVIRKNGGRSVLHVSRVQYDIDQPAQTPVTCDRYQASSLRGGARVCVTCHKSLRAHRLARPLRVKWVNEAKGDDQGIAYWVSVGGRFSIEPTFNHSTRPQGYWLHDTTTHARKSCFTVKGAKEDAELILAREISARINASINAEAR